MAAPRYNQASVASAALTGWNAPGRMDELVQRWSSLPALPIEGMTAQEAEGVRTLRAAVLERQGLAQAPTGWAGYYYTDRCMLTYLRNRPTIEKAVGRAVCATPTGLEAGLLAGCKPGPACPPPLRLTRPGLALAQIACMKAADEHLERARRHEEVEAGVKELQDSWHPILQFGKDRRRCSVTYMHLSSDLAGMCRETSHGLLADWLAYDDYLF